MNEGVAGRQRPRSSICQQRKRVGYKRRTPLLMRSSLDSIFPVLGSLAFFIKRSKVLYSFVSQFSISALMHRDRNASIFFCVFRTKTVLKGISFRKLEAHARNINCPLERSLESNHVFGFEILECPLYKLVRFPRFKPIEISSESQSADNRKGKIVYPIRHFHDAVVLSSFLLEPADHSLDKLFHVRAEEIETRRIKRLLQMSS